jgi:ABC-type branched-subunit amino acid transport system substrate-binding protein
MKTLRIVIFTFGLLAIVASCTSPGDNGKQQAKIQGVTDTEILIGSSLALGGHANYLGIQTLHGAMAYLNHFNAQGGAYGRQVRLIAYDDGYDPPRCVANTQKLIAEDQVFALFCYVGTPTTVKIIPLVEKARIPLVGMFTGANALREPPRRWVINIRASYYQETAEAVNWLVEDLGLKRIAVFYQYDAYGFDGLKGTEIALQHYGLEPVASGSYIRGTMDVEQALEKVMASKAEAVVMIGTYDPCAKFIKTARTGGFDPLFVNVSFVGGDELARKLGEAGEGVIVTQVVPLPEAPGTRTLLGGVNEYTELLKKYYPADQPNYVGLEGYINARVLVEGLLRAGHDLTREGFINAIESIKNYSLGIANPLSFSSTDHQGFDRVYFTRVENGQLVLLTDLQKIKEELAVPGITRTEITFGSSLALGGHAGYLGTETLHGALSYINFINELGGIHGRKIKIVAYDDEYDPPRCVANTQRLIHEDKVFGLFCYLGTPTALEIIPIVQEARIPLLGLFTGAHILRVPVKRYIINVRASYYEETAAAIKHFVEDLQLRKIAVFYQDDTYGLDGLMGAKLALKKYGMAPIATGSYLRGTRDVEKGLNRIMATGAEAVVMVGTYDPCAKFIILARKNGFEPIFYNVSFVGADELARRLGKHGEGVLVSQVVPPPEERILVPATEDYARLLAKYYPEDHPNFVGFEGFINAKILVEGLRRAGRDITREKYIDAVESLERYFVGIGAKVSFGPQDHQGLEQVYFTKIEEGMPTLITDWEQIRKARRAVK